MASRTPKGWTKTDLTAFAGNILDPASYSKLAMLLSYEILKYTDLEQVWSETPALSCRDELIQIATSRLLRTRMSTTSLRTLVPRGLAATRESVQSTAVLLGTSLPSIFSRLWAHGRSTLRRSQATVIDEAFSGLYSTAPHTQRAIMIKP